MRYTPFSLRSILFDSMLSCSAFFLGMILFAGTLIFSGNAALEDIVYAFPVAAIIGTVIFYMIRRQFSLSITILQAAISLLSILILAFPAYLLLNSVSAGIPLIWTLAIFVLSKHVSDWIIIKRKKGHS